MLLLEQNSTRKKQVNRNATKSAKLDISKNSSKYEIEAIFHSAVYKKESKSSLLSGLYYLVF